MWQYADGNKHIVFLYIFLSVMASVVDLFPPFFLGRFLNEIQNNGIVSSNINYLSLQLFAIFIIPILFWAFHGPSRILEMGVAYKIDRNFKKYLLKCVMSLGLSWHGNRDSGDTIDKVNKASDGLFSFSSKIFQVISVIIRAVGTTIILISFNLTVGFLAIGILIGALTIIFAFDKNLIPKYKKINNLDNKMSAKVFDVISNITTVKVLNIEKPVQESLNKSFGSSFSIFQNIRIISELKWFTGSLLFRILVLVPFSYYIYTIYRNNLAFQIGTISSLYLYLSNLDNVFYTFAGNYEEMVVNKSRVLNAEAIEKDYEQLEKIIKPKVDNWTKIEIKNLVFKYQDHTSSENNIKNIDFNFQMGEKVALIGESGSGKSTFLKILHGLYPNSSAKLFVHKENALTEMETNFANIDLHTTLVPQEPEVFSASIKENITLLLDFTDKEIKKATDMAEFTNVLGLLPHGIDSVINEKGVNLSGGQKQRLALTRALLFSQDKNILLLDESTSSVDPENEVKIYQNIFKNFENKTILATIHKMNLLKYFDRIVIFSNGEIIDESTFADLLVRNQKFKNDWEVYIKNQKN